MLGGIGDLDVGSHVPHAETATNGTDHQEASSSDLVDQEEKIDDCAASLDDTKETSSEEGRVGADNADTFEDRWRIVVDGIDT